MEATPKRSSSKRLRVVKSNINVYAAQCGRCDQWRVVGSLEEYENIRSKLEEDPFFCEKKPNVSCNDPADIAYDTSRIWVIDKPNVPKTPEGFKRLLVHRKDFSKLDIYYITPTGKKLRTTKETAAFLQDNNYKDVSLSDFNFAVPKIMEDTIPQHILEKVSKSNDAKRKKLMKKKLMKKE